MRKLKVDSCFKMLRLFTVYLVIFIMRCIGTPIVHKCFVCGPESEQPFIDEKFLNVTDKIQKTCENFDQILEHAKETYAIECPSSYKGCITRIGNEVTRTCSDIFINDCQKVNGEQICICNQNLCNGEKAKSQNNLHTYNEDDTEEESDENDQESGDDDNYESFIHTSTTHAIDSSIFHTTAHDDDVIVNDDDDDDVTEKSNEFVKVSVSTMQPSINIAVNFNLSQLVLIKCAIIFAVSYLYSWNVYVN